MGCEAGDIGLANWCSGRGEERFNLCLELLRGLIFVQGAKIFDGEEDWQALLDGSKAAEDSVPTLFSGGEELFDEDSLSHCFSREGGHGKRKALLANKWRSLVWKCSCWSAHVRFGGEVRSCSWRGLEFDLSMEELYRKLFQEPSCKRGRVVDRTRVELETVWQSLELFESSQGRSLGRPWSSTDPAVLVLFWSRAAAAWVEGWPRPTENPANDEPEQEFSLVPREAVESLGDGMYRWKRYTKEAGNLDEALKFFNEAWLDEQQQHFILVERANMRKSQALRDVQEDFATRIGPTTKLLHPRYDKQFFGRLVRTGARATFIESGTWLRVELEVGEGGDCTEEDLMSELYLALRGDAELS